MASSSHLTPGNEKDAPIFGAFDAEANLPGGRFAQVTPAKIDFEFGSATPAPMDFQFGKASATTAPPEENEVVGIHTLLKAGKEKRQALLEKQRQKLEEQAASDYDTLAEKDQEIDRLKNELSSVESRNRTLRESEQGMRAQQEGLENALKEEKEAREAAEQLNQDNRRVDIDRRRAIEEKEQIEEQLEARDYKIKKQTNYILELEEENASFESTNAQLHIKVDSMEDAADEMKAGLGSIDELKKVMEQANEDFEGMFKDLGTGLTLADYVKHVKELQLHTLQRETSHGTQTNQVVDLGQELRDAGIESSDELELDNQSDGDTTDGLDDLTLLDRQLDAKNPVFDQATQTVANTLSFALIQSVETQTEIDPPSPKGLIRSLKFAWYLALILYVCIMLGGVKERVYWLAANDSARQHLVELAIGGGSGWVAPVFLWLEDMMDVHNVLLG